MPWWLDLLTVLPVVVVAVMIFWFSRQNRAGAGFLEKQTDYLDHQRSVNEKSLEQQKVYEQLIATQYAETNARSDRALQQSEEAIRLHAAALDQLAAMNATLARLARKLEA